MALKLYLTLENGHRKPDSSFSGHMSSSELFEGWEPRVPLAVRFMQTCSSQSLLLFVGEQIAWNRATHIHLSLLFFCSLSPTNVLGVQHQLNKDVDKEIVDFK